MSNVSISTGSVLFTGKKPSASVADKNTPKAERDGTPMHIALVADFSGRGSRGETDLQGLASRKAWQVDRDNFEELFSKFNVSVKLAVSKEALRFSEFDELHPDYLYENLALFADLRSLRRRLNKKDHFAKAADEIQRWAHFTSENKKSTEAAEERAPIPLPTDMFDAILTGGDTSSYQDSPVGDIQSLIKDIVAPYVEPKADPRLPEYLAAVDQATAQTLRRVLHADAYQDLEAAWRCVDLMVRRIDTGNKLKLFLIDVSQDEIRQDLASTNAIEETALYKRLVEQQQVSGSTPFGVINLDITLTDTEQDCRLASALSHIGEAANAAVVAGAATRIAGCEDISRTEDVDDWCYSPAAEFSREWQAMREQKAAAHLGLCAPRFLVRMPYGKRSSPIESFEFEELTQEQTHHYYLWANSAYLVTYLLAVSYSRSGWQLSSGLQPKVDELPLHIYTDDDESKAKACAEVYLRDRAAERLASCGILSVRSVVNEAAVIIPNFRSVAADGSVLFDW
ncbi:hypothetical protein TDB9533_04463 [Thalassocella blandensis]|nr:hypothetical protein TDB9533_04463 [Thalassocella blandensis]